MEQDIESSRILKDSGIIVLLKGLGLASTLVFNLVVAVRFGISSQTDAFFLAWSIPTIAISVLPWLCQTVLVPLFSTSFHKHGEQATWAVANSIINCGLLVLGLATLVGLGFSSLIFDIVAPGFDASTRMLTVQIFRVLLLTVLPTGLFEVIGTLLNSLSRFAAPAATLFIRYAVATVIALLSQNLLTVSVGLLLGATFQGVPMILMLAKKKFQYSLSIDIGYSEISRIFGVAVWPLFGLTARQVNFVFERSIASLLPYGSVTALSYAYQLVGMVDRVFSSSIFVAAFSAMSGFAASKNLARTKEVLLSAIRLSLFIACPVMFGLMALNIPIVRILFEHKVEQDSIVLLSSLSLIYCFSIPFQAVVSLFLAPHYASHNTKTPAFHMIIIAVVNLLLDVILVAILQVHGLALAYSLTYMISALRACWLIRGYITPIRPRLSNALKRVLGASFLMGACVWALYSCVENLASILVSSLAGLILTTVGLSIAGFAVYLALTHVLGIEEASTVLRLASSRKRL